MMNIKRMLSCIAVVVAALLLAVSCGNMLEAPKAEGVEGGMGRLSVSMGDGRAVFPEELKFEEDKELTFTLSGSLSGGEGKEIHSWSAGGDKTAYQVMVADTSLTVEAGQWSFTLQAKRGGTVVATASKDLEVKGGTTNKLSFGTMAYSDEGTGTVTVTISWNEVEQVTSVVVGLYNASDDTMVSGTEVTFDTIEESKVTYKQNVPAGIYRLKAKMYQNTDVIGTYSELVRVAGGLSSEAERNLESLNTLYTVTLDLGGQGELRTTFPETYNRSQTVTLPTAEQVASNTDAYSFAYWYEKDDTEKKAVTEIAGLDGDKTYCAYWQVAPVTFSLPDDTKFYCDDLIAVSLETTTDGATIQYKLDDGEWMDYTEETPISVTTSTTITITARATKDEFKDSEETTATYTVRKLEGITVTTLPAQTVYSERQSFDPTGMVVTATYDDKSQREVTGWETDFNTVAGEKGLNKPVTVSYMEGGITREDTFTVDVASYQFTETVQDVTGGNYKKFGDWPQTIKEEGVEIGSGTLVRGGLTYHVGSEGNYYVKITAKPYEDTYTYSDGNLVEKDKEVYFKVEPIVWRVLTTNFTASEGGNALLLAESILTGGIPYYVDTNTRTITGAGTMEGEPNTVYPNNWQYSTIRAWLNGLDVVKSDDVQENDKTYAGKGFLQTAFTADAQSLIIAETTVDNSAASTNPASNPKQWEEGENPYASDTPTKDKVFLLSEKEATTGAYLKEKGITDEDYGFATYSDYGEGNTRIRVTTDYAKATGAYQDSTEGYGGWWWLRSPLYDDERRARVISDHGSAYDSIDVSITRGGVVPALSISLGGN